MRITEHVRRPRFTNIRLSKGSRLKRSWSVDAKVPIQTKLGANVVFSGHIVDAVLISLCNATKVTADDL